MQGLTLSGILLYGTRLPVLLSAEVTPSSLPAPELELVGDRAVAHLHRPLVNSSLCVGPDSWDRSCSHPTTHLRPCDAPGENKPSTKGF